MALDRVEKCVGLLPEGGRNDIRRMLNEAADAIVLHARTAILGIEANARLDEMLANETLKKRPYDAFAENFLHGGHNLTTTNSSSSSSSSSSHRVEPDDIDMATTAGHTGHTVRKIKKEM